MGGSAVGGMQRALPGERTSQDSRASGGAPADATLVPLLGARAPALRHRRVPRLLVGLRPDDEPTISLHLHRHHHAGPPARPARASLSCLCLTFVRGCRADIASRRSA
jgi:hypothetical protein